MLFKVFGTRQHHGQACGLHGTELRRRFAEIMLRSGFRAEYAFSPFDIVEVDFQDTAFSQQPFQTVSECKLLRFAGQRALARKKEVLGQLLTDRGGPDEFGLHRCRC